MLAVAQFAAPLLPRAHDQSRPPLRLRGKAIFLSIMPLPGQLVRQRALSDNWFAGTCLGVCLGSGRFPRGGFGRDNHFLVRCHGAWIQSVASFFLPSFFCRDLARWRARLIAENSIWMECCVGDALSKLNFGMQPSQNIHTVSISDG